MDNEKINLEINLRTYAIVRELVNKEIGSLRKFIWKNGPNEYLNDLESAWKDLTNE